MNKFLKYIGALLGISIVIAISIFMYQTRDKEYEVVGLSNPGAKWFVVKGFNGYQTKIDLSKLPNGANGMGQNTTANDGDKISIRDVGIELFPDGTASTTEKRISSVHTFRKKTAENIMMRAHGTILEYYEETGNNWTQLKAGYTDNQKFGFADYQRTLEYQSYTYFGNAVEPFSRWTGVHTQLTQDVAIGTTTVHVTDIDDLDDFSNTGTIVICGIDYAYASRTQTSFIIATSTNECASGTGIPEAIEETTGNPRGNIYLSFDNRLLIAGIASTTQAVYFSEYGDPNDYIDAALVSATTATDPDIFNLVEGGGAVTGLTMDENALYIFKRSIIYRVTLTDTDYNVTQLKPFDGKSQTTGLVSSGGAFTGGNEVFFVTPDNQIMEIKRIENVDFPQIVPISDVISNTVANMGFNETSGIVFRNKAYITSKSTSDGLKNDTVLVWNIIDKMWDSPLIGWNVEDFVVYDNGDGEELYISSTISPNIYKVNDIVTDDIFEVKANWRSKQFNFDSPEMMKDMSNLFIEGKMTPNTTLSISLLLDENGFSQTFTTELSGNDTQYFFDGDEFNIFGFTAFGSKIFGSSGMIDNKNKFRVYLGKDFRPAPFYNASIEFASEGLNDQWEITNFGFEVKQYSQPIDRNLYKAFKN